MQRRTFLKTSALAAPAVASTAYLSPLHAQQPPPKGLAQKAEQISEKIFGNDSLSIPIAMTPKVSPLAKGLDRTMVLGGGGVGNICLIEDLISSP